MPRRRLTFRTFSSDSEHARPAHSHADGQFTYVRHGLIGLETETEVWINETKRLFWIPPGLVHASSSRGPVDGWLVLIPPQYARALPPHVCVLHASPLLVASLERLGALRNAIAQANRRAEDGSRSFKDSVLVW